MSGRDIFEWGVSKGLVNKKTLSDISLHEVQHDGPVAYATVTNRGLVATDAAFTFRQEEGQWKIDIMGILHNAGSQLDAIRKQAGKSKVEMAIFLLERTYQKPISPSILNGPLK